MKILNDINKYYLFRALIKRFALPIIVVYFLDIGLSIGQIGSITAITALLTIILEIPSGTIADLMGHKRAIILSAFAQAVSMALYIFLSGFWGMLVASLVFWGSGTLMSGTVDAYLYEILEARGEKEKFKKFYGRAFSFGNGATIPFLIISSLLYVWHPELPFLIGVLQYVLAGLVIYSIRDTGQCKSVEKEEGYFAFIKSFKQNSAALSIKKPLIWLALFDIFFFGLLYSVTEFDPAYMENIGLSVALIGTVYALHNSAIALGAVSANRLSKKISTTNLLYLLSLASFVFIALYRFAPIAIVGAIFTILMRLPYGAAEVISKDAQNRLIATGSRSTFLSVSNFGTNLMKALGAMTIGFVAAGTNLPFGIFVVGIAGIFVFPFLLAGFEKTHQQHK